MSDSRLGQLEIGPASQAIPLVDLFATVADRLAQGADLLLAAAVDRGRGSLSIPIDLEEGIIDRVVEPRAYSARSTGYDGRKTEYCRCSMALRALPVG